MGAARRNGTTPSTGLLKRRAAARCSAGCRRQICVRASPVSSMQRSAVLSSADRIAPLEATHFWFVARDELFDRLLSRVAVIEPLLDLGCGTGRFAARLSARGTAVVAADLHLPGAPAPGPAFIVSRTDGL